MKKSDLASIKTVSKSMIYADVQETKFSPIIVKHPYTDSGIIAYKTNNKTEFISLLDTSNPNYDQALKQWQSQITHCIDAAQSPLTLYCLITKSYRLSWLKQIEPYLRIDDLSNLLINIWTSIEYTSSNTIYSKKEFIRLFSRADPKELMDTEEYETFISIPPVVTVYRGIHLKPTDTLNTRRNKVQGLSWTLDKQVAVYFSTRYQKNHTSIIPHEDIRHEVEDPMEHMGSMGGVLALAEKNLLEKEIMADIMEIDEINLSRDTGTNSNGDTMGIDDTDPKHPKDSKSNLSPTAPLWQTADGSLVLTRRIPKEHILCYTNQRGEKEVIINPFIIT